MLYWLATKLWKTKLYSQKLANTHFWIGTLGILFYSLPLYVAGFVQASMWKQFNPDGTLVYGNFLETVTQILPMYAMRAFGGTLYLTGFILLAYNIYKTAKAGSVIEDELVEAAPLKVISRRRLAGEGWHSWLERRTVLFTILTTVAILVGGAIEIIPLIVVPSNIPKITSVKPYTPLELEGRDIYIREGCNNCHSQMIRPFRSEVERYGEYSKAGEFVYDRPFLWGSKRTGPDLAREGVGTGYIGGRSNLWHFDHMLDPRRLSPGSIMPSYPWLITDDLDTSDTESKLQGLVTLGTPYTQFEIDNALHLLRNQAEEIANNLKQDSEFAKNYGNSNMENKEIIAMIAYLQRLGTDIKKGETAQN